MRVQGKIGSKTHLQMLYHLLELHMYSVSYIGFGPRIWFDPFQSTKIGWFNSMKYFSIKGKLTTVATTSFTIIVWTHRLQATSKPGSWWESNTSKTPSWPKELTFQSPWWTMPSSFASFSSDGFSGAISWKTTCWKMAPTLCFGYRSSTFSAFLRHYFTLSLQLSKPWVW